MAQRPLTPGRTGESRLITVRVTDELTDAIAAMVQQTGSTQSAVLRAAIARGLDGISVASAAKPPPGEMVKLARRLIESHESGSCGTCYHLYEPCIVTVLAAYVIDSIGG